MLLDTDVFATDLNRLQTGINAFDDEASAKSSTRADRLQSAPARSPMRLRS